MKPAKSILSLSLIFIFLTLSSNTFSQDGPVASVNFGVNFPMGEYSNSDFSDPASGFAKTGGNLNLQFGYKFNDYIGVGVMAGGIVNRIDQQKITDEIIDDFKIAFPNANVSVETKQWGMGGLMAGAMLSLPLGKKAAIDGRAFAGFFYVYSPEIRVNINRQSNDPHYILQEKGKAPAFAYDLGASLRYNMRGHKYVSLNCDYIATKPEFKDVTTYYSFDNNLTNTSSFNQNIQTVNITIGIGYFIR